MGIHVRHSLFLQPTIVQRESHNLVLAHPPPDRTAHFPEADTWLAENIRSAQGVIAEVRVLNGRAVLADLTFDGKPFREILKKRKID